MQQDDTLILVYPSKGAALDFLAIASITQVVLMVADMWSRRRKEQTAGKAKKKDGRAQGEVRGFRILLIDGNWMKFDSWLTEPNELKSFIQAFQSPTISPKLLYVQFVLENGSKLQLYASSDFVSGQQLDALLHAMGLH